MTRAEIIKNIQYNENLLSKCTRELYNMRHKEDDYKNQLKTNNYQLEQLLRKLKELKAQLDELNQLIRKFKTLRDSFIERHNQRAQRLKRNFEGVKFYFIRSYVSGMDNLLSGPEYTSAIRGLAESIERIEKRRNSNNNDSDKVQNDINNIERKISNIQDLIKSIKSQMEKKNAEIANIKKRIDALKKQLQYVKE